MVALRRLFHAEKPPSTPVSEDRDPPVQSTSGRTPNPRSSPPLSENEHFQNIEKQFEVLHEQLKARPMSTSSHIPLSRASSRLTSKNPRHIDLLDALFSSHRYHVQSSGTMSPTTPYNEDVAERNMAPFLRGQNGRKRNAYTRIISALYQEDVADRNIAENRRRSRSLSRTRTRLATSHSYHLDLQQGSRASGPTRAKTKESHLVNSISQEALYSVPKSVRDQVVSDTNESMSTAEGFLRTQRSAPTVLSKRASSSHGGRGSRTEQHLEIPPAHKQGSSWTNTPLPDSPTLPTINYFQRSPKESRRQQDSPAASTLSPRLPGTPKGKRPSMPPRSGSKKNLLDLSINTELAARGRPKKILHRAIQPPTPSSTKQNPSIAEIMNSPLPVHTPTPSPLPSSNQKVAEIMDMFRKAYASSQAISPHPTFETLQDAIIREINSHEAFQRVPVPEPGPPFTPSPSRGSFEKSATPPKPSRSSSLKDGQLTKLIRKTSQKTHRRGSEARKSISTIIPNTIRRDSDPPSRRRHTDAPPPSPGFFDTLIPQHPTPPTETVTYMDLLLQSANAPTVKRNRATSTSAVSCPSSTAPLSVLYMRAQTSPPSTPSNDSPRSFAADADDSDIIHLPSISGIPRVQIHGVDENNVTYTAENTTPRNAQRLMNWPRKSSRSTSLQSNIARNGRSTSGQSVASY
ncbi:hypothetical protein BDV12DRAFT_164645 [Aspergillus spectabilis]